MDDDSTAARIFGRHHREIHRYLLRMTGNPADADELAQEVFLRVVRGLRANVGIDHERGWVFSIAHNLVFDEGRKFKRTPPVASLHHANPRDEPRTNATQFLVLALVEALDSLPDDDREVFVLKELSGLSYEEIATASGGTVEAVRSRLYRVRATLRKKLSIEFAP